MAWSKTRCYFASNYRDKDEKLGSLASKIDAFDCTKCPDVPPHNSKHGTMALRSHFVRLSVAETNLVEDRQCDGGLGATRPRWEGLLGQRYGTTE